jgi:hypothetical protein
MFANDVVPMIRIRSLLVYKQHLDLTASHKFPINSLTTATVTIKLHIIERIHKLLRGFFS